MGKARGGMKQCLAADLILLLNHESASAEVRDLLAGYQESAAFELIDVV